MGFNSAFKGLRTGRKSPSTETNGQSKGQGPPRAVEQIMIMFDHVAHIRNVSMFEKIKNI
jgi:hypothetical protein